MGESLPGAPVDEVAEMRVGALAVDLATVPVLLGVVAAAVVALAAVWFVPKRQARRWAAMGISGKELAELENGARSTLVQIVGGVALILTFAATWMQIADTRKATDRTLRLNAAQQETDRFARAIEQLGSKQFELRLGAIYSLESAAIDTPRQRRPIVRVLLAYLHRQHPAPSTTWRDPGAAAACVSTHVKPAEDTQAALDVIVQFGQSAGLDRIDLTNTNLIGVRASGADLSRADLRDSSLARAHLDDAQLDDAILNRTDLSYVCLNGADLHGATIGDAVADGADFSRANLDDAVIIGTSLESANVSSKSLRNAEIDPHSCPPFGHPEDCGPG